MEKLEAQINGLILKFLDKMYPDSLTVKLIEALLYDWRIFITEEQLLKENISYLIDKGYIEGHDVEIPAPIHKIKKVKLTPKGKALLKGELLDSKVDTEI